jgi:hypothetical protein
MTIKDAKSVSDPELYARCARVHVTEVEVDAAVRGFTEAIEAAREAFGISDFVIVFQTQTAAGPQNAFFSRGKLANEYELATRCHRRAIKNLISATYAIGLADGKDAKADEAHK